jgi:DNA-binding MarR family transcriptional regulator
MSRRRTAGQVKLQDELLHELKSLATDFDALDDRLAEQRGIARTDLRVLDFLSHGGAASAGQLAEIAGLTSGATTTAIDRLEQAGLVQRRTDPRDGRRVLVEPTPTGLRHASDTLTNLRVAAGGLLEGYTTEELVRLREFIRSTRDVVAAHAASLRRQRLRETGVPLRA